jgi:hypothetical protein
MLKWIVRLLRFINGNGETAGVGLIEGAPDPGDSHAPG